MQTSVYKGNGVTTLKSQACLRAPFPVMSTEVNQSLLGVQAYDSKWEYHYASDQSPHAQWFFFKWALKIQ